MGFLSPWFLAGAAAVGLPIYLHLLRRQTTTPRPFSSLMFFERRTQSSIKHRRLRYLFLLSLRTLLLLLLALAFANPFINRSAANMNSEKLVLLVIDNSFSMRAGTRLADARREALSVLSSRRPADHAQIMALGSQLQVLTQPSQDAGALRAAVESLQPGDSHAKFRRTRARPCAPCRRAYTHRSNCTCSATCRNPRCRQASRNWRCLRTFRWFCIRW